MVTHKKLLVSTLLIVLLSMAATMAHAQSTTPDQLQTRYQEANSIKDHQASFDHATKIAEYYLSTSDDAKALEWYSTSLRHANLLKDIDAQYRAYEGIGVTHYNMKSFNKAVDAFEKGYKFALSTQQKDKQMKALMNMAKAEQVTKRCITPLEKALQLALELKDVDAQLSLYQSLTQKHEQLGNKHEAQVYQNMLDQILQARKQARKTEQKMMQLNEAVSKVQSEKMLTENLLAEKEKNLQKAEDSLREAAARNRENQMKIDLLSKDQELAQLKLREQAVEMQNQKLWTISLIIGISLSFILIAVIIVTYRKSVKAKQQIQKQNENIKSSIAYAKRIQEAMLPSTLRMGDHFQDSFVLFQPRDVVSGDFYWCAELEHNKGKDLAIAAVDCTGHGIPGAFMSMVGMNSLNGLVSRGVHHSDEILANLHTLIRDALRQEHTGNNDGMDIALCIYRKEQRILEFSGAKNPLVYIQNNELFQVKGDIHPIGGSKSKATIAFKKHEIKVEQPTMFYLFSDGYRDQFGGADNRKFMSKKFNELLLSIHQLPMQEQKNILERTMAAWKGQYPQTDDILVIGVSIA